MEVISSGMTHASFLPPFYNVNAIGMVNYLSIIPKLIEAWRKYPIRKVMDSGGYQNNTDLEGYARAIIEYGDEFEWFANLDVIGDQRQSNKNYERLINLIPSRLHHKILWIYQYSAETMKDLDTYLREHGPFIGVGGLVPLTKNDRELTKLCEVLDEMGEIFMRHDAQMQGFGFNSYQILTRYGNAPYIKSCDSTLWMCAIKSFQILDAYGRRHNAKLWQYTDAQNIEQNIKTIRSWTKISTQLIPRPKNGKKLPTLFDELQETWHAESIA